MTYGEHLEKFFTNFVAAGASGAVAKTMTAPLDRLKVILQNQESTLQVLTGQRKPYKGLWDLLTRIPTEQGYLSLWRGNAVNVSRYATMQAFNFSLNDYYKRALADFTRNETVIKFVAGGMAGASALTITYPLDFCQTRLVADVGTDGTHAKVKREFSNFRMCLRKVYTTAGVRGCYRGLSIAIIGIALYRSLYFGLFETAKLRMLEEPRYNDTHKLPFWTAFGLAQLVTAFSGIVAYPFDTVLRRTMLDSARPPRLRQYTNARHAFRKIYGTSGLRGFYAGMMSNILRGSGGAMVLVFYDEVIQVLKTRIEHSDK